MTPFAALVLFGWCCKWRCYYVLWWYYLLVYRFWSDLYFILVVVVIDYILGSIFLFFFVGQWCLIVVGSLIPSTVWKVAHVTWRISFNYMDFVSLFFSLDVFFDDWKGCLWNLFVSQNLYCNLFLEASCYLELSLWVGLLSSLLLAWWRWILFYPP